MKPQQIGFIYEYRTLKIIHVVQMKFKKLEKKEKVSYPNEFTEEIIP